jgi:phosphoribosylformylglycinamidine (FGAM) synthase PurS component
VTFETQKLYKIEGTLTALEVEKIAHDLLHDPILETYIITQDEKITADDNVVVDVWYKPGVTDTVGETVERGIHDLGIATPVRVHTGLRYCIQSSGSRHEVEIIVERMLVNTIIQEYIIA